jgi:hypothetical protein
VTARPRLSFAPAARVWRLVALALTIAASLAIVATHFTFSNTYDEPANIAGGMEWLASRRRRPRKAYASSDAVHITG